MRIDPDEQSIAALYHTMVSIITPRPIAWVSTISDKGVTNLAPYSYFSGVGSNPPSVCFSPCNKSDGSKKDTLRNIEATGEFVVNVVSFPMSEAMNGSSADFDSTTSEFEAIGVAAIESETVAPPGVAAAPVRMECERFQIVRVGEGPLAANLVIGIVRMIHIADEVLTEGRVDGVKLDAVGRMGGANYCRTQDSFSMPRPATR